MSEQPAESRALRMEKIVSLSKRRGFIYPSSEIYGGIGGFWDYGPMGAEVKRNLRDLWWRAMTRERDDVVGLDASIIMNPAVWRASGHVDTFADLMRECSLTNKRVRADHVEPQSGIVYRFSGATSASGWKFSRSFEAMTKPGEHEESFRKRLRGLLAALSGKDEEIELLDEEKVGAVTDSVDFHPESFARLGEARPFNLMLKTYVGPTATEDDVAYLRPETAQAIFAQFKNVLDSNRVKVPFGVCQIGKAFRNEVTPKNFTFRSREFEQMELEFFIKPDEAIEAIHGSVAEYGEGVDLSEPEPNWGWDMWHRYWVACRTEFYNRIGLGPHLSYYWQTKEDLAHYARACVDILFDFPFGIDELEGIAARGDFDLTQHQKHSGKPQEFFDEDLKKAVADWDEAKKAAFVEKKLAESIASEAETRHWCERFFKGNYVPHVIEPSAGLDRLALAVMCAAYHEEDKADVNGKIERRTYLRLDPKVAPIKVAVLPLVKNKPEIAAKAREIHRMLKPSFLCFYDETAAIGRRYARQDEIGTPYCVTVDFDTLGENGPDLADTVTLRERDSGEQTRLPIGDLVEWLRQRVV